MFLFRRFKYAVVNLLAIVTCIFMLGSCNSTRFVPDGKYLLNKVSVKADNKSLKKEDLKLHIRQKENLKILGIFKFHLGVYNLSSSKPNDWLKQIGEAPVLFDESQTQRTKEQLQIFLKNKGYYNAVVNDSLRYSKSGKKIDLLFDIKAGKPYRIRNYSYLVKDKSLETALVNDSVNQLLKPYNIFDLDVLNAERQRIATFFKNQGYYKFSEDFVSFEADSNFYNHQVDIKVIVDNPTLENGETSFHKRYKIRNYIINPIYKAFDLTDDDAEQKTDTLTDGDYQFIYSGKLRYKPVLFYKVNRLKDSTYYSLQNAEKTYRAFNRLKQFKLINISFNEIKDFSIDSIPLLDCKMQLSPMPRQNFSVDVEGTNSSGNFGVAGNLNYQQRNVFGGAEVFDIQLRGARERQQTFDNSSLNFNTQEFGLETSITIPKFLSFLKKKNTFLFNNPETKLSIGYNYQDRPDYTRTITNMKYSYNWQTSRYFSQTYSLLDLNYVRLTKLSETFINKIKDLYIKSSFTDHLIFASNYTWLYNSQNINKREDYKYFKASLESAGNLLSLYSMAISKSKISDVDTLINKATSYYEILNTRFAQYLKGDFEYRYGYFINETNSLVGRFFLGVGVPYGNFNVLPFEKKYFTGGANGIRAWPVRSLGPGSYKVPSDVYPNQSSDIKLEANFEYRFKLIWRMEGALFTDAGNIWAINYKDNREGAVFKINQFYRQIAIGSGFGLRFDFTYFLFRLDLGVKMRDPSLPAGKRFIPGNYKLSTDHLNLSFAIGYPF